MIVSNTLTNNRLEWQALLPDTTPYQATFDAANRLSPVTFAAIQSRLENGLAIFCHPQSQSRFMLLKAQETREYLALIAREVNQLQPEEDQLFGSHYQIQGRHISVEPAEDPEQPFAAKQSCAYQEWIEAEQLFGCVRVHNGEVELQPGLVHQVNGGVLILSVRAVLAQPMLWLRLKQMVTQGEFHWLSPDETRPLPVSVPPMPLELRVVLVGDRLGLGEFQDIEPEIAEYAVYGEFEDQLQITELDDMTSWCSYVDSLATEAELPAIATDAWPLLLKQAVRYSGDQGQLPLCPQWITQQLSEAALYCEEDQLDAKAFDAAITTRQWRENYLIERLQDEIELGQVLIETEGEVIGQINALSVLEYPGHPRSFGEPTRISCVVHQGDGELTDVERKAELGGNLHAKGMMIMEAFLVSELELDQPLPFSASLVFEQSYGEVDGDSASMAELCALISALSLQPITQQIAVTGSVDQFGNVQPIGGVNEKIEGFFEVCQRRGFTQKQGVIIPATNVRHLCLSQEVVDAVREGQFHIWAVDSVTEALPLLTGYPYADEQQPSLLAAILERIAQANQPDRRARPWILGWMNWFNRS